jgi:D-xylose transport system ATP-binding protein
MVVFVLSAAMASEGATATLELRGISKRFGGVEALTDVGFTVDSGEIVALVGDNGAGKSTLLKTIAGIHPPDAGSISVRGKEMRFANPAAASAAGIATVYQDLALCDNLDVVRNMFLGRELRRPSLPGAPLDMPSMEERVRAILGSLGVRVPSLRAPVARLSGGQRQGIAIGRALLGEPSVVQLDEPTAALGVAQRQHVLELILRLREQDRGVIVVSHDLRDVQQIADRVVVLRLGRTVAEFQRGSYDPDDLVAAITGSRESVIDAGSAA